MDRFYRFAGITFRVTGNEEEMYREEGILLPFRVSGPGFDHSVSYRVVDSLPRPEGEPVFLGNRTQAFLLGDTQTMCMGDTARLPEGAHTHIRREGSHSLVQVLRREVPEGIKPRLVLNTLEAEHHIVRHGGFLLHSSFVQVAGRAILFTAPSGTGKSTQSRLWEIYRGARVINGDRTAVIVEEKGVFAHGIPYCGTSGISVNEELPVAAIVYLSQGPESAAVPLTGLRAFRRVWEGCSVHVWNREDVELCTNTVAEAIRRVPVVHLTCKPDESAVNVLEAYLQERGWLYG
jgi:hypothetical protein